VRTTRKKRQEGVYFQFEMFGKKLKFKNDFDFYGKKLSLCHNIKYWNAYIFAT